MSELKPDGQACAPTDNIEARRIWGRVKSAYLAAGTNDALGDKMAAEALADVLAMFAAAWTLNRERP